MSISTRPLILGICLVAACSPPHNNGGDDDDATGDGGRPTDACPCPDAGASAGCQGAGSDAAQPFGNHARAYHAGTILPSHSQEQLDDAVRDFYDHWKADYLRAGCGTGRYYILSGGGHQTVSEAHGYGMLVMALMAGHDPQAKTIFDGLVHYYQDHPSEIVPSLMSWAQGSSCQNVEGVNSATDGDLDIAYALLLADKQWSSGGAINYRALAGEIIDGIRDGEVDTGTNYVQLGDWAHTDGEYGAATRSSDFMPAHYESFAAITGDTSWRQIRDRSYAIMSTMQNQFAAQTGLLPDFIADAATMPRPVNPGFLEGATDGQYGYNACRDPWRIATDYVVNGDPRSKTIAQKMTTWIRQRTGNDPDAILPGYSLSGTGNGNYLDLAFVAPFGVAAMVDGGNQSWLDSVWDTTVAHYGDGYYQDTIALLSLITMSGNWWAPEAAPCP
ncbi:MAG TPA: glycosyl hydrolase family 8 [Kofleriaceae bacterium]|nr:glycosyl hydrolase family 8 [Kofleriaceae bacterium]